MYAFIEVTSLSTGRKVMINIDAVVSISKTESGLADIHTNKNVFTTHENYDDLIADLRKSNVKWSNR